MPQLDPTWYVSQLFWLCVCMALLYLALSRAVLPPLMRVAEARRQMREDDLARAQALKDQAEFIQAAYEQAMNDARVRAQAIFAEVEERSESELARATAELHRVTSAHLAEAERHINARKEHALSGLAPALASLTAAAVEKLTSRAPDAAEALSALRDIQKE
ncbi:MAG: hypothetical protein JO089_06605 [Alphaproteobacteria bacterium]|nr:hypothetical protein [Alphaproteobacteria bacterium]